MLLWSPVGAQEQDSLDPWMLARDIFHREYGYLNTLAIRDNLSSIYDLQTFLNSLLVRATIEEDYPLIDSLSAICLQAATMLREVTWYPLVSWKRQDSVNLGRSYRMWAFPKKVQMAKGKVSIREEHLLSSSQFLFLVAQTLRAGLNAPPGQYPRIDSLITLYPSILLEHHYQRWIIDTRAFRLSGWGCMKGVFNHGEMLTIKRTRKFRLKPVICPVVTDIDLFIIAGTALMLDANRADSIRVPIAPHHREAYRQYLREAERLLAQRIEFRAISTGQEMVEGFAFDNGYYRDYKDHRYALYSAPEFPLDNLKVKPSPDAAWDVSHARRFIFVFNALQQSKEQAGLTLDYERCLHALARQFYHVIYTDTVRHLFANYLNGDNGWHRVNYHGAGFGHPPYSMSKAALEGGWFFLGSRYPPIAALGRDLLRQFRENPEIYNRYYGVIYRNYQPVYRSFSTDPGGSERLMLLQWLPAL